MTKQPFDGIYSQDKGVRITKTIPLNGRRPHVTILTMFTSRDKILELWLKHFKKLDYPKEKVHLLWVCYTGKRGGPEYEKRLRRAFRKMDGYYAKTLVVNEEHRIARGGDKKGGDWMTRNQAITDGYNFSRLYIENSEYVFLYEDDVLIPPDGLKRLMPYMENEHIGQVIGRVPYRPDGRNRGKTLAWDIETKHIVNGYVDCRLEAYYMDKQHAGVEEIGAGTFGCTLVRGKLFKDVHMINNYKGIMGPDVVYGPLLKERGYKSLIDWGVHCSQMHESRKGVEIYA